MKQIAILGSTGSIGTQALDVIRLHSDLFHAQVLAARKSVDKLLEQAMEFKPAYVVITDEQAAEEFKRKYTGSAKILTGEQALCTAAGLPDGGGRDRGHRCLRGQAVQRVRRQNARDQLPL